MPQLRRCNLKKMPRQESVCLQIDFWRFVNAIAASCDYPAKVGHSRPVHSQQSGTKQHQTGPSLLPALQTEEEQIARAIAASMGQEVPPVPSSGSPAGPGQGLPQQRQQQWGSAGGVPSEGRRAAGPPSPSVQQPGAQKGGGCSP